MTKQEKHALKHMMDSNQHPCSSGPSYDANWKQTSVGDGPELLSDPNYIKGYKKCHAQYVLIINFLMTASKEDLIKYAGRAK